MKYKTMLVKPSKRENLTSEEEVDWAAGVCKVGQMPRSTTIRQPGWACFQSDRWIVNVENNDPEDAYRDLKQATGSLFKSLETWWSGGSTRVTRLWSTMWKTASWSRLGKKKQHKHGWRCRKSKVWSEIQDWNWLSCSLLGFLFQGCSWCLCFQLVHSRKSLPVFTVDPQT